MSRSLKTAFLLLLLVIAVTPGVKGDDGGDESKTDVGTVIGIDLGTTYSCVAVMSGDTVEIIPNDQGNRITPSYVAFTSAERLIGDAAKHQAASNPENTVYDVKRLIGRKFSDKTVQRDMKMWPFKVVSKNGKPYIQVSYKNEERTFAPEEISAMVLSKMKNIAEAYLNKNVTHAVVTVPAYFDDSQRLATKDAGTIAGLTVMRIINEPTAAAIAYGLNKNMGETNVVVYDLGGGTFDVSLLTLDDGVFEVLATSGDTHLGGEDFDMRVMNYFMKKWKKKYGGDISTNERSLAKLRREVEKAKRALSSSTQVKIEIESLMDGKDFSETLTRARFEELNNDLFRKTLRPLKTVLEDAAMKKSQIDEIVLVGGSTRIPKVREMVKQFFNGKEPNRGVNPDEAVAHGAAVQGCLLAGGCEMKENIVVLGVTPLSYGIETVGGLMTNLINKQSSIPTSKTQVFSTYQDNQPTVSIQVFQGERAMTKDNIFLGKFELSGIPPAPRGVPEIEVTFDVDVNGILSVTAREKKSGEEQSIVITADQGRLSDEEIDEMLRAEKLFAEEDREMRLTVESKNRLEAAALGIKNEVGDRDKQQGQQLSDEDRAALLDACDDVLTWMDENPMASKDEYAEKQAEFDEVVKQYLSHDQGRGGVDDDSFSEMHRHGDLDDEDLDELHVEL